MRVSSVLNNIAIATLLAAVADCGKRSRRGKPAQLPKPQTVVVELVDGSPAEIETIPVHPKKLFKQLTNAVERDSEVWALKLIHGNDVARQAIIDNMYLLPQRATAPMVQLVWAIAETEWCEHLVDRLASNGALSLLLVTGKAVHEECKSAYAAAVHEAMSGVTPNILAELEWPLSDHISAAVEILLKAAYTESAQRLTEFAVMNMQIPLVKSFLTEVYMQPLNLSFLGRKEVLERIGSTNVLSVLMGAIDYLHYDAELRQVAIDTFQSVGKGPFYCFSEDVETPDCNECTAAERAVKQYIVQKKISAAAIVCAMFEHLDPVKIFDGANITSQDSYSAASTTIHVACNKAQAKLFYYNPAKILFDQSGLDPTKLDFWVTYKHFAGEPSTWAAGRAAYDPLAPFNKP